MNRPATVCPVCTKEIAGYDKAIAVPGVGVVHYGCRDGAPARDTGTMRAPRCRVCRRGPVLEHGDAHDACVDAETIAARLIDTYMWAMVDTRELAPAARVARIELLCDELRSGITTAIIGAGNRGQG